MAPRRPVVVAALCALGVAIAGGLTTDVGPWYRSLAKSPLTPPDWVFAPAWMLIYALAVLAAVDGWRALRTRREQAWLLSLFFVNAVLNVLWSTVFFAARRPDWAMAELITLWASVLALIVFLWPRARVGAILLLPYLLWVTFAGYLNYEILVRNGPFA
jgi:tryptophan-rich sensory protein